LADIVDDEIISARQVQFSGLFRAALYAICARRRTRREGSGYLRQAGGAGGGGSAPLGGAPPPWIPKVGSNAWIYPEPKPIPTQQGGAEGLAT